MRIPPGGLTARQTALIGLLREGKSNASIAQALGFSVGTIKAEIQSLLVLLTARDRKDIVVRADRAGLSSSLN